MEREGRTRLMMAEVPPAVVASPSSWVQWAPGSSTVDTSSDQPSRDHFVHNLEKFGWLRFSVFMIEKAGL